MNKTTIKGITKLRDHLELVIERIDTQRNKLHEEADDIETKARANVTCSKCGNTKHNRQLLTGDMTAALDELYGEVDELGDVENELQNYMDACDTILDQGYDDTLSFFEDQYPEVKQ